MNMFVALYASVIFLMCIHDGILQSTNERCIDCEKFNRLPSKVSCAKSVEDCGECISEFITDSGVAFKKNCEAKNSLKRREAVKSSNENTGNVNEQSGSESPGIYVACVFGGLCVGFTVGGLLSLLAYQCYFKPRYLKRMDTNKAVEMEPMCRTENGIGKPVQQETEDV